MSDVDPIPEPESPIEPTPDSSEEEVYAFLLGDVTRTNGKTDLPPATEEELPSVEDDPFKDAGPIGDGVCVVCGAPTFRPPGLTKAGHKKRTPKYCDLHDPKLHVSPGGPGPSRLESDLKRLQEELADELILGGTLLGFGFPVTGYFTVTNADPFSIALLKLCKNNQRVLRVLHRAATVAPIYEIAKCMGGFAYSLQVDQNKADPHNAIAQQLGVTRAYDDVYKVNDTVNQSFNNNMTGPPRYATVQ